MGTIEVPDSVISAIREGRTPKPDVLATAELAAIAAMKRTDELIPYCHSVDLEEASVECELHAGHIEVTASAAAVHRTGVEMEALTAVSVCLLNLYDLLKPLGLDLEIGSVRLVSKSGGLSERIPTSSSAQVIVVSDRVSAGTYQDKSGQRLNEALSEWGFTVAAPVVVPDELEQIQTAVRASACDFIALTGGTGVAPRDVTPEAVRPLIDQELPGIPEAFRSYSGERFPLAYLSRTVCGFSGEQLILCLPGSPGAIEDASKCLLPLIIHALSVKRESSGGN